MIAKQKHCSEGADFKSSNFIKGIDINILKEFTPDSKKINSGNFDKILNNFIEEKKQAFETIVTPKNIYTINGSLLQRWIEHYPEKVFEYITYNKENISNSNVLLVLIKLSENGYNLKEIFNIILENNFLEQANTHYNVNDILYKIYLHWDKDWSKKMLIDYIYSNSSLWESENIVYIISTISDLANTNHSNKILDKLLTVETLRNTDAIRRVSSIYIILIRKGNDEQVLEQVLEKLLATDYLRKQENFWLVSDILSELIKKWHKEIIWQKLLNNKELREPARIKWFKNLLSILPKQITNKEYLNTLFTNKTFRNRTNIWNISKLLEVFIENWYGNEVREKLKNNNMIRNSNNINLMDDVVKKLIEYWHQDNIWQKLVTIKSVRKLENIYTIQFIINSLIEKGYGSVVLEKLVNNKVLENKNNANTCTNIINTLINAWHSEEILQNIIKVPSLREEESLYDLQTVFVALIKKWHDKIIAQKLLSNQHLNSSDNIYKTQLILAELITLDNTTYNEHIWSKINNSKKHWWVDNFEDISYLLINLIDYWYEKEILQKIIETPSLRNIEHISIIRKILIKLLNKWHEKPILTSLLDNKLLVDINCIQRMSDCLCKLIEKWYGKQILDNIEKPLMNYEWIMSSNMRLGLKNILKFLIKEWHQERAWKMLVSIISPRNDNHAGDTENVLLSLIRQWDQDYIIWSILQNIPKFRKVMPNLASSMKPTKDQISYLLSNWMPHEEILYYFPLLVSTNVNVRLFSNFTLEDLSKVKNWDWKLVKKIQKTWSKLWVMMHNNSINLVNEIKETAFDVWKEAHDSLIPVAPIYSFNKNKNWSVRVYSRFCWEPWWGSMQIIKNDISFYEDLETQRQNIIW